MKIERIETFRRDHLCMVRVTDADGAQGWGQTAPFHPQISEAVLYDLVAPWILGREVGDIGAWAELVFDRCYKFTGTFLCRAVAGVETALWDLAGRRQGVPVASLIGGAPRNVLIYGSAMSRATTAEEEAERIARLAGEKGVRAFKIKIGPRLGRDDDVEGAAHRTESLIPRIREALPGATLFADANGSYDVEGAVAMGETLIAHDYAHFEEPCPHLDIVGTAEVTRRLDGRILVTGGEQDYMPPLWRQILDLPMADVVQPDVLYNGGVARTLAVARMAAEREIEVMPHCANRSLIQVVTQHLITAMPNARPWMEWSIEPSGWTDGLFTRPLEVEDGAAVFPEGPGWGVDIHPDWLAGADPRSQHAL